MPRRGIAGDRIATKAWIRARVRLYAKRLSLSYMPTIVFSPEEWANRGIPYQSNDLSDGPRGLADAVQQALMINLDKQLCRHDADDTAAHEVCHLRWPSMPHGDLLAKRTDAVRAGFKCGPAGTTLPQAFRKEDK